MANPLVLGVDLGTSAAKALLVDAEGRVVGRGEAAYPIVRPAPDRAEQDPGAWWSAAREAIRAALGGADTDGRVRAAHVVAIGVTGQMHGTVLLDRGLRPLGRAIVWPDRRSTDESAALARQIGRRRLLRIVGGPVATGFQAGTLAWVRRHDPSRWDDMHAIATPTAYLRLRLTGELAVDRSDAAGTALLDERTREWSAPVLRALGVDRGQLPALREATDVAGGLRADAADELGLPSRIPVVVGAADTACGLLGAGLTAPDALLLTISSGGQLVVPATTPDTDPRGRIHTFCAALPPSDVAAGWYRMAATLSAGLALRWLRDDVLGLPELPYDELTRSAADVPVASRGLVFLPYLEGERSPHMDPLARGVLLGLTARHGRPELVRAVLEGVTLACREAARPLAELGSLPGRLILAGGGARSELWRHIVADVFGLPVRLLETGEQAALGACALATEGAGIAGTGDAAARWARLGPPIEPDPAAAERYAALLPVFRRAYRLHRADFAVLSRLDAPAGG